VSDSSSSAVIICTRNRPAELESVLESLASQTSRSPVWIVDASDAEHDGRRIAESSRTKGLEMHCVRAAPGLTRQRMVGLGSLPADVLIVHFLDDDVVLEPGYLAAIEAEFARDPRVVGACGFITDAGPYECSLWNRLCGLSSDKYGHVLGSGVHVRPWDPGDVVDRRIVKWLPGCCMSYRRRVFDVIGFDVCMTGYCLGEDLDFSFRAGKLGLLVATRYARLEHHLSPMNRLDSEDLLRAGLMFRYRWVSELRGHGVSRFAYWWSFFGPLSREVARLLAFRHDSHKRCRFLLSVLCDIARLPPIQRIQQPQRGVLRHARCGLDTARTDSSQRGIGEKTQT